ncbi:phosphotransferase [Candidatus Mycoplasma pogonae]
MKIPLKKGLTNVSYKDGDLFVQEKVYTKFNHKLDYSQLKMFDFVPELISDNDKEIVWKWIEGQEFYTSEENLKKIAAIMKTIHTSKLQLPASNHAARVKEYRKILQEKNINIPVLNKYYKKINLILKNMKKDIPCHNDLWFRNMIIDNNNKIFVLDWEYATKGDKHFDLAYFIESSALNDEQETILLDAYEDYDYEYILQHRIFVNYLIILWIHAQKVKPENMDDKIFQDKIEKLVLILEEYQAKWKSQKA